MNRRHFLQAAMATFALTTGMARTTMALVVDEPHMTVIRVNTHGEGPFTLSAYVRLDHDAEWCFISKDIDTAKDAFIEVPHDIHTVHAQVEAGPQSSAYLTDVRVEKQIDQTQETK